MKSTKTMLLLTFYLTTTQISIAHTNPLTWVIKKLFFDETEEKQTERNKKKDIDEIMDIARKELCQLYHHELKNKDKINQILRSIIVTHVENQTRIIAYQYTSDQEKINGLTSSMRDNVIAILKSQSDKNMPPMDNKELSTFFGNKLDDRIRTRLQFNENRHNSEYPNQSYDNQHPKTWRQKNPWHSNTKPSAPTYAD